MRKIIIKHNNSTDCTVILHADLYGICQFQWYISDEKEKIGTKLDNQVYESLTVNSSIINKFNWDDKYVYCVILQRNKEGCECIRNTEYTRLSSVFEKAMEYNQFDDINMFNDKGSIIPYV